MLNVKLYNKETPSNFHGLQRLNDGKLRNHRLKLPIWLEIPFFRRVALTEVQVPPPCFTPCLRRDIVECHVALNSRGASRRLKVVCFGVQ